MFTYLCTEIIVSTVAESNIEQSSMKKIAAKFLKSLDTFLYDYSRYYRADLQYNYEEFCRFTPDARRYVLIKQYKTKCIMSSTGSSCSPLVCNIIKGKRQRD